jgi:hypothetical protein
MRQRRLNALPHVVCRLLQWQVGQTFRLSGSSVTAAHVNRALIPYQPRIERARESCFRGFVAHLPFALSSFRRTATPLSTTK